MGAYRIAVMGAGFWGTNWLLEIGNWAELELVAAVGQPEAAIRAKAAELDLPESLCFTDAATAIRETDPDIVAVVTPPFTHLEVIRSALDAGKHVVCEKPLADTWDNAVSVYRCAKQHPECKFMVSQTRRFVPQVETLRTVIQSGKIGQLSTILFDHRVYDTDEGWRLHLDNPVLQDMSAHHFDAFRYITGEEPLSVYAEAYNPPWSQYKSGGCNSVLIAMTNGIHVNYYGSWTTQGQQNSYDGVMKAIGSNGSLDLLDPQTLLYYPGGRREAETNPEPEQIAMLNIPHTEIGGTIEAFLGALRDNRTPPCDIDDNIRTFALNWAALESSRQGTRVQVPQLLETLV